MTTQLTLLMLTLLCYDGIDIWHLVASQVKKHDVTYSLDTHVKYAQLEFILYLQSCFTENW